MNKYIENHPTIICQNDIAEICRPLKKLNITYFCHVNINDNRFSALANNPGFHRHYLENEYYNADIHMADSQLIKDHFIWDSIERRGKSLHMHQEAGELGVKHTFTILEKNHLGLNYYHFATNQHDRSINQVYLANLDILKLFTMHFIHQVHQSRQLSRAYDIKFGMDPDADGYTIVSRLDHENNFILRREFLSELKLGNHFQLPNGKSLTERQLKILYWLHNGKTISDISSIMHLAEITVHKHVADIKSKTGCYTQFQMGEYFSKLFSFSPDLIDRLSR